MIAQRQNLWVEEAHRSTYISSAHAPLNMKYSGRSQRLWVLPQNGVGVGITFWSVSDFKYYRNGEDAL